MTEESRIATWLATQQEAMVAMLREMVDTDSGSYNKPGIDAVGAVVQRFLAAQGIPVETIRQAKHGDCLRAAVPWDGPAGNAGGNVILMGHRDTVFPDGEAARRPFTVRDGIAYGPGVADMKAGLVMNCFVLAAFAKFGGSPAPLVGLFTGDEEIGSPEGRAGDRGRGPPRPSGVQQRTRPRVRQRRHRAQGRRLHELPGDRQGRPFRRELRRRHQCHRGTRTQGAGDPRAHRPRPRHYT